MYSLMYLKMSVHPVWVQAETTLEVLVVGDETVCSLISYKLIDEKPEFARRFETDKIGLSFIVPIAIRHLLKPEREDYRLGIELVIVHIPKESLKNNLFIVMLSSEPVLGGITVTVLYVSDSSEIILSIVVVS